MDKIAHKLLTKLIECILQSRVDIQKKQIRHFDEINKQIMSFKYKSKNKDGIESMSLDQFLNSLLLHQKFAIASKISIKEHCSFVNIYFRLKNIKTGEPVLAEAWLVQFEQFRKAQEDHDAQQFQILVTLFEELIIFLNRQPLFSEYQRNSKMKNFYNLQYEINIKNEQKKDSTSKNLLSIMDLNHKHTKQRVCKSFLIKIQCYYLDSLIDSLMGSTNLGNENKEKNQKQESSTTQTKFKESSPQDNEKSPKNRKFSVYQFYDQDLDFVFLSSDDETFKKSPKSEVKEINITGLMGLQDDDDQFELLIISKDDEFLDDSKTTFIELSENQGSYFTI